MLPLIPLKKKTFGFLMFSGGSKGNIGKKRVKKIVTIFYGKYVSSRFMNTNGQTDQSLEPRSTEAGETYLMFCENRTIITKST